jgi:hypothetical protein
MKYFYGTLVLSIALSSQPSGAEEYRKIHDNLTHKVVEVCATDPDGTLTIATRCHYNLIDIPIISYAADPKLKRKATDVTEIITPVHNIRNKDSVYAVFEHSLVEVTYGMANGTSSIIIDQPSGEALQKYSNNSNWLVGTAALGTEVTEVDGKKVGDKFCLKHSPEPFPDGLPVKITHLFNKDHFAVIDTISDGFLGFGNVLKFEFTELSNLVACGDKPSLDPLKNVSTSAPKVSEDLQVNGLTGPKEGAALAPSTTVPQEQPATGTAK